jgi:hypothetical protein
VRKSEVQKVQYTFQILFNGIIYTSKIINEKSYSSKTARVPLANKEMQSDILQTGATLPASVVSPAECLDKEFTQENSSQDINYRVFLFKHKGNFSKIWHFSK